MFASVASQTLASSRNVLAVLIQFALRYYARFVVLQNGHFNGAVNAASIILDRVIERPGSSKHSVTHVWRAIRPKYLSHEG